MATSTDVKGQLTDNLKDLRLPTFRDNFESAARSAESATLSYEQYLLELTLQECEDRRCRKVERLLAESKLPLDKTFESFDLKRLPAKIARCARTLLDGTFIDRKENVLAFGSSGAGKTHLLCAVAQELIRSQQRRVYFTTCSLLVQDLLAAKRDLKLSRYLKRMSKYDIVFIDDIGYVQQDRNEMEVLFTFLAERYERGSVMLTSNLPFSKWESILKDPMTTAAAIDRVVHHSVILELNLKSYRLKQATERTSAG